MQLIEFGYRKVFEKFLESCKRYSGQESFILRLSRPIPLRAEFDLSEATVETEEILTQLISINGELFLGYALSLEGFAIIKRVEVKQTDWWEWKNPEDAITEYIFKEYEPITYFYVPTQDTIFTQNSEKEGRLIEISESVVLDRLQGIDDNYQSTQKTINEKSFNASYFLKSF